MIKTKTRTDFLNLINQHLNEKAIAIEVGVFDGSFSKMILSILNPNQLYLNDPWQISSDKNGKQDTYSGRLKNLQTAYSTKNELDNIKQHFKTEIESTRVIIKQGFSYDIVNDFEDDFFDFIYIDACHLYECVKQDLIIFLPKLKKGGLLCGHDYINNDVGFEVKRAVDEFCELNEFSIFSVSEELDWCLKRN
jgi:hypothetical protein